MASTSDTDRPEDPDWNVFVGNVATSRLLEDISAKGAETYARKFPSAHPLAAKAHGDVIAHLNKAGKTTHSIQAFFHQRENSNKWVYDSSRYGDQYISTLLSNAKRALDALTQELESWGEKIHDGHLTLEFAQQAKLILHHTVIKLQRPMIHQLLEKVANRPVSPEIGVARLAGEGTLLHIALIASTAFLEFEEFLDHLLEAEDKDGHMAARLAALLAELFDLASVLGQADGVETNRS